MWRYQAWGNEESPLKFDSFDKILLAALVLLLAAAATLLATAGHQAGVPARNLAMERFLSTQARWLFIQSTYGPVEQLLQEGQQQEALLKLAELAGRYPGEAHGMLLKATALNALGAQAEAIASFGAAVRLQGEYLDRTSPMSRRKEIARVTEQGLATFVPQVKTRPDDPALKQTLRELNYLKSRLAGGCE